MLTVALIKLLKNLAFQKMLVSKYILEKVLKLQDFVMSNMQIKESKMVTVIEHN